MELLDVEDIVRKVIGNRSDLHRSVQKIDAVEDYKSIEGQADDDQKASRSVLTGARLSESSFALQGDFESSKTTV